jgi:hypothetical protein
MRGGGTGARRREVFCGSGALGRPRLLPYPAYLPSARAPPTKEGTSDRQEAGRESSLVQDRLHGALSTARLIPPLLLPWFRTLVVAFAHDYYYRRRIAILMGTRHARARSHDLLTTYRVRMGRHVTTLITTVLSRCISQPIMRTPLPAIAAPVLTCPATP